MADTHDNALAPARAVTGVMVDYAGYAVTLLLGLVVTPVAVRTLGATVYGLWVTLGSIAGYAGLLDFGQSQVLTRLVAHGRGSSTNLDEPVLLSSSLAIYAGAVVALLALLLPVAMWPARVLPIPADLIGVARVALLLQMIAVGFRLVATPFASLLRGTQRFTLINSISLAGSTTSSLVTLLLFATGSGLMALACGTTLGAAIALALMIGAFLHALPNVRPAFHLVSRERVYGMITAGLSYLAIGIGVQAIYFTDNLVISAAAGLASAAPYSIAFQLIWTQLSLVLRVGGVLLPAFAHLVGAGRARDLRQSFLTTSQLTLALAMVLALGSIGAGAGVIRLWVGPAHFAGMPTLATLAAILPTQALINPSVAMLMAAGRHKSIAMVCLVEGALNFLLSIALVRPFGIWGVALGTLLSQAGTTFWLLPMRTMKELGISPYEYVHRVVRGPAWLSLVGLPIAFAIGTMGLRDGREVAAIAASVGMACAYCAAFFFVGLDRNQRAAYLSVALGAIGPPRRSRVTAS